MTSTSNIHMDLLEIQILPGKRGEKKNKKSKDTQPKTIIIPNDYFFIHFISIIQDIRKIPDYGIKYWIPEKMEPIIQQEPSQDLNIISDYEANQTNLVLLSYTIKNDTHYIPFSIFLRNQQSSRQFLFHLQNSYKHIIERLQRLAEKQIYYFHFSSQNIIFSEKTHEPLLQYFHLTFRPLDPDLYKKITHLLENLQNFSSQPLEVHTLFFIHKNKLETISYSQVELISQMYVKKMPIFSLFSDSEREKYRESCVDTLKKYENKPSNQIVESILKESCRTWEFFGLSVLYLHLIGNINRLFSLKDTFFNDWEKLLIQNLDADPLKRNHLSLLDLFDSLYKKNTDWKFVKSITSNENREKWIEILS